MPCISARTRAHVALQKTLPSIISTFGVCLGLQETLCVFFQDLLSAFRGLKKKERRRPPALLLEEKENIHNKENTAFKLRNGKGRKEEKKSRKKTTKLVFTLFLSLGTHHHKHREYRVKQPTCCLSFFILSCLFVLSACMISDVWRGERKRMTGWRIK